MDKEFELVTKKKIECYLKATEEIEDALNLTVDFLNDLMKMEFYHIMQKLQVPISETTLLVQI